MDWKKYYEVVGRMCLSFSMKRSASGRRGSAVFLLLFAIMGAIVYSTLKIRRRLLSKTLWLLPRQCQQTSGLHYTW